MAKKMVLLIIEFNYHAEVLRSIIPLLKQRFDIILLTTDRIWQKTELNESDCALVLTKTKAQPLKAFFQQHHTAIRRADIVYFNTIERNFEFFLHYDFACPVIARLHNTNADFFPWSSIDFQRCSLFKIGYYLLTKVLLRRLWSLKKRFFKQVDGLMLPSSVVRRQVLQRSRSLPNILPYCLPFCSLQEPIPCRPKADSRVVFAVTGTVDPLRKDYDELYAALERMKSRIKTPVKLFFLGGPQGERGKQVIERFRALESPTFEFVFSLSYVKTEALEKALSEVDFFIAPLRTAAAHRIHRERYGCSKISGIESDIINFQKPALITAAYGLDESLQPVCASYEGREGLAAMLERWVEGREYQEKQANFTRLEDYRPEVILDRFENLCSNLIACYSKAV